LQEAGKNTRIDTSYKGYFIFNIFNYNMINEEEEKSPILGSWPRVYALVIGVLVLIIVLLYIFTRQYQ